MELPAIEKPEKPIKPQWVRNFDVFILGPFMVYAGTRKTLPKWARILLIASGVLTSWYNQRNYLIYEKLREQLSKET